MNTQKHAPLPCARRIEMKRRVTFERISFTQAAAEQGVAPATCCAKLGMSIKRLLNDNGSALRSHDFARVCQAIGIKHRFTPADLPPTGRRRTQRPNGSSSRPCASGPTAGRARTHRTEPQHWPAGNTMTTGTARTAALAGPHPCPELTRRQTTS